MPINKKLAVVLVLIFSTPFFACGQEVFRADNPVPVKIDEYFSALASQEKFNGTVIVAQGDNVLVKKAYNLPNNVSGLHISVDNQLMIASVAKLFVKLAFLKLEEQGGIKLDDKLNKFIPDFPNGDKITIRHLVSHTSGLPRELANREKLSDVNLEKLIELAKLEKLEFEPGAETLYSNIGYQMLLYILGKTAPGGYEKFIDTNLLKLYSMPNTYEYNYRKPTRFSGGFILKDKKITPADASEWEKFESGRFYSTIGDMWHFSRGLSDSKITSSKVASAMTNDKGEVVHAGSIDGYKSYFYKNTKTGLTYIFLSNYAEIPLVQMTKDIPDIVAGKPVKLPTKTNRVAIKVDEKVLHRYVGKYALKIDTKQGFEVMTESGKLYFVQGTQRTELFPESETLFFTDPHSDDDIFEFVLDEKTQTYKMFLTVEGGIRLEAVKTK